MRIIQLINRDGEHAGLYSAPKGMSQQKIDSLFIKAFDLGEARKQHYLEMNYEEEIDIQTEADEYLEKFNIERVYAVEMLIDKI